MFRHPLFKLCAIANLLVTPLALGQGDPALVGQFSSLRAWPNPAVHTHMLPTGQVMFYPEFANGDDPRLWDPASETFTPLPHAGYNIFCSGHSFLADGRLLLTGG